MLANFLVPILDDGWRFIALFAGATFLAALTGAAWYSIALFLGLGLLAHLADLAGRWRR